MYYLSNDVENKTWEQIACDNEFSKAYLKKNGAVLGCASLRAG